jgi:hypothetical protein
MISLQILKIFSLEVWVGRLSVLEEYFLDINMPKGRSEEEFNPKFKVAKGDRCSTKSQMPRFFPVFVTYQASAGPSDESDLAKAICSSY